MRKFYFMGLLKKMQIVLYKEVDLMIDIGMMVHSVGGLILQMILITLMVMQEKGFNQDNAKLF